MNGLTPHNIVGRDIGDAWWQALNSLMVNIDDANIYSIQRGSYQGQKRIEFDFATIKITHPGNRPLSPVVPSGYEPPCNDDYIKDYLDYLISPSVSDNEEYTYGSYISDQIPKIISMYGIDGHNTNQGCIRIGDKESIDLENPPCLVSIDTRVKNDTLHFFVYFRSWDLFGGMPANLGGIQLFKETLAEFLDVKDGQIIAMSKGLHIYDHCVDNVLGILHFDEDQRKKTHEIISKA